MKYVKKAACLLLAALMLAACFGCSGKEAPDGPDVDLAAMQKAMLDVDTTLPEMVVKSSADADAKDNFFFLSSMD
ncbi:MAG: hypothetical protein K2M15_00600, partial [Oscillospiraceae bacterium]|nr:hypothetical protein [Oscillospiraceae bacterium]